jgi:hypothetical protein
MIKTIFRRYCGYADEQSSIALPTCQISICNVDFGGLSSRLISVECVSEKDGRATANQKRNNHCHRCLSCETAAIELLRDKSQIRFMMNCMLAIPCVARQR